MEQRAHWATGVMETPRPWTNSVLRRLTAALRESQPIPPDCPTTGELLGWYNDLAVAAQTFIAGLDWSPVLETSPRITARPKTLDTLREKLERMPHHPVHNIQDLAGVRIEADMSLTQQDRVGHAILDALGQSDDAFDDLRATPHSGYRAVHLKISLPAGRVEVQVRTALQGQWANMYEALADLLGRDIRYGAMPSDPGWADRVRALQGQSTKELAELEGLRSRVADLRDGARMGNGEDPRAVEIVSIEREIDTLARAYNQQLENLALQFRRLSRKEG